MPWYHRAFGSISRSPCALCKVPRPELSSNCLCLFEAGHWFALHCPEGPCTRPNVRGELPRATVFCHRVWPRPKCLDVFSPTTWSTRFYRKRRLRGQHRSHVPSSRKESHRVEQVSSESPIDLWLLRKVLVWNIFTQFRFWILYAYIWKWKFLTDLEEYLRNIKNIRYKEISWMELYIYIYMEF